MTYVTKLFNRADQTIDVGTILKAKDLESLSAYASSFCVNRRISHSLGLNWFIITEIEEASSGNMGIKFKTLDGAVTAGEDGAYGISSTEAEKFFYTVEFNELTKTSTVEVGDILRLSDVTGYAYGLETNRMVAKFLNGAPFRVLELSGEYVVRIENLVTGEILDNRDSQQYGSLLISRYEYKLFERVMKKSTGFKIDTPVDVNHATIKTDVSEPGMFMVVSDGVVQCTADSLAEATFTADAHLKAYPNSDVYVTKVVAQTKTKRVIETV